MKKLVNQPVWFVMDKGRKWILKGRCGASMNLLCRPNNREYRFFKTKKLAESYIRKNYMYGVKIREENGFGDLKMPRDLREAAPLQLNYLEAVQGEMLLKINLIPNK